MSREIDTSKELSPEDVDYLLQRGRYSEVQAAGTRKALDDDQTIPEDPVVELVGGPANAAATDLDSVETAGGDGSEGDLNDLTVPELQALLRARDLPVSGSKPELIARLED